MTSCLWLKSHKVLYPLLPLDPNGNLTLRECLLSMKQRHIKSELLQIVRKTQDQQFAWPFREPVDTKEVKDYLDIIPEPIDLSTIEKRIRKGDFYKSKQMLQADLVRMVHNCKLYNDSTSTYYECAVSFESFINTALFPNLSM